MSELRALTLIFLAATTLLCAVCGTLMAIGADGGLIAVAFVLIAGTGAHLISRVMLHYGAKEERRKREELLRMR